MATNSEDEYDHPIEGVMYVPENVPGKGCDERLFEESLMGCGCANNCAENSCSCVGSRGLAYDLANGDLVSFDRPVLECHERCKCPPDVCHNRAVQKGPVLGLEVKRVGDKGWGLFCSSDLRAGQFVCCYAGEVIGESEASDRLKRQDERGEMNYIIFADERRSGDGRLMCRTIVDPTAIGNLGRYANHSCGPNMSMHTVRTSHPVPHLSLFANRSIAAGEELTFDYGDGQIDTREEDSTKKNCLCGSTSCRGYLPFSPNLTKLS